MSSLSPPSQASEAARRNLSLINRARRAARRSGDFKAEEYWNSRADEQGHQTGGMTHAENLQGVGMGNDAQAQYILDGGRRPPPEGKDIDPGFEGTRRGEIDPGFTRVAERTLGPRPGITDGTMRAIVTQNLSAPSDPAMTTYQATAAPAVTLPPPQLNRTAPTSRDGFREAWKNAGSQAEKDAVVRQAHDASIPMNQAAVPALIRHGRAMDAQRAGDLATRSAAYHPMPSPGEARETINSHPRPVVRSPMLPTQQEENTFQQERRAAAGGARVPDPAPGGKSAVAVPTGKPPSPNITPEFQRSLGPLLPGSGRTLPAAALTGASFTGLGRDALPRVPLSSPESTDVRSPSLPFDRSARLAELNAASPALTEVNPRTGRPYSEQTADPEYEKSFSTDGSIDMGKVDTYAANRMDEARGRSAKLAGLRTQQQDALLAGELLDLELPGATSYLQPNMSGRPVGGKGAVEAKQKHDPKYDTPGVRAALEKLRRMPDEDAAIWKDIFKRAGRSLVPQFHAR